VVPRPLTVGVYLDALLALGVEEGQGWDAASADPAACLAALDALCESVVLPDSADSAALAAEFRRLAAEAWGRVEEARASATALAARYRLDVEAALGEGLVDRGGPRRHGLLRDLSQMPPAERAALCAEPLARTLVLGQVGALVRQAEDANREALETAQRSGGAGRSGRF